MVDELLLWVYRVDVNGRYTMVRPTINTVQTTLDETKCLASFPWKCTSGALRRS